MAYARKALVVGSYGAMRREFAEESMFAAYEEGYRGTVYRVGMEADPFLMRIARGLGDDAFAVLGVGTLFDRLATVERMADGPEDFIIVHDWFCSYPVFDPTKVSEDVLRSCREVFDVYHAVGAFDYIVAVDKDSEHVPNIEWLERSCGVKWEDVPDFECFPQGLAKLITGA